MGSFNSMTFRIKTLEHLKFEMKIHELQSFQIILILLMSQSYPAYSDCQGTFTPECQRKIKAESKEVGIIQCWGKPLYAYCKASDGTVFHIPGYDCEHST